MALNTLNFTAGENVQWSGGVTQAGLPSGPAGGGSINETFSLGKSVANTVAGGADTMLFQKLAVANGTPAVINLSSFADIAGQASQAMARVKEIRIHLLGINDKDPAGNAGNACTGVTVGGGTTPFGFGFSTASVTFPVNNASRWHYRDGSGNGIAVTTNINLQIANNDAGNVAQVLVMVVGATS